MFVDDPLIVPGGNVRFDTAVVSGIGRLRVGDDSDSGLGPFAGGEFIDARFTAVLTDAGEPGGNDTFEIEFPDGESKGIRGALTGGNHQTHRN